jgi:hypothetical protein
MTKTELRPELPPLPSAMKNLPVDRGYPVPWFVAWVDGKPDFRIMDGAKLAKAIKEQRCWTCGRPMIGLRAYVVGPMCAVNRTSAEPPSHLRCAEFSVTACPFLTRPHARRRGAGLPEESVEAGGIMIRRNPGVTLVWVTAKTQPYYDPSGGILFDIGHPSMIAWYAEGRDATREEILESMNSGMPLLLEEAEKESPDAVVELGRLYAKALTLVPA